jgi:hypothetical protein
MRAGALLHQFADMGGGAGGPGCGLDSERFLDRFLNRGYGAYQLAGAAVHPHDRHLS